MIVLTRDYKTVPWGDRTQVRNEYKVGAFEEDLFVPTRVEPEPVRQGESIGQLTTEKTRLTAGMRSAGCSRSVGEALL